MASPAEKGSAGAGGSPVPPSTDPKNLPCGLCDSCKDMPRFGGKGIKRKRCVRLPPTDTQRTGRGVVLPGEPPLAKRAVAMPSRFKEDGVLGEAVMTPAKQAQKQQDDTLLRMRSASIRVGRDHQAVIPPLTVPSVRPPPAPPPHCRCGEPAAWARGAGGARRSAARSRWRRRRARW